MISGYMATSPNLSGYRGPTCSLKNCPVGDTTTRRNNLGGILINLIMTHFLCVRCYSDHLFLTTTLIGVIEKQRVVCPMTKTESFALSFRGQITKPIYGDFSAFEIKNALEELSTLGNISITFPYAYHDNIGKACSPSVHFDNGGFLVSFLTDFGEVPILSADKSSVEITRLQKGTKVSLECSGSDMGICNRETGSCECFEPYTSSDGSVGQPGNRGDCAYYSKFLDNPLYTKVAIDTEGESSAPPP